MEIEPIAYVRSDFPEKFGIPRQSGLVEGLRARIVFTGQYKLARALEGLAGFDYIWLIWGFSANEGKWSPTVRPPRLGGNTHLGVWATRSPFRPNSLGLSCVRLVKVHATLPDGPELEVAGADLMDGTPIYDIKPYIAYADAHEDAACGWVDSAGERRVRVHLPAEQAEKVPADKLDALLGVLESDPRPSYKKDGEQEYGLGFAGMNVRFRVLDGILTVIDIQKNGSSKN